MKLIRFCLFFGFGLLILSSVIPVSAQVPATDKIVFSSNRDGNSEIYMMNTDGSGQVNLTHHRGNDYSPVWSPTGKQILFASDRAGKISDLYLMNADGEDVRRVFGKKMDRRHPTWSPDGEQIAYYRVDRGEVAIYTASIKGGPEKRLEIGMQPAWAPDGSEIAFISADVLIPINDRFGGIQIARPRIEVINVRTKAKEEISPGGFPLIFFPTWIPDGTKFVFSGMSVEDLVGGHVMRLYTVNRKGNGEPRKVKVDGEGLRPALAPDGNALVYQKKTPNGLQLFKVALAGGISEQLTDRGSNSGADWFDPAFALTVSPQPNLLTTVWGRVKVRD
jgi:Tol biopolymer transport system component